MFACKLALLASFEVKYSIELLILRTRQKGLICNQLNEYENGGHFGIGVLSVMIDGLKDNKQTYPTILIECVRQQVVHLTNIL